MFSDFHLQPSKNCHINNANYIKYKSEKYKRKQEAHNGPISFTCVQLYLFKEFKCGLPHSLAKSIITLGKWFLQSFLRSAK